MTRPPGKATPKCAAFLALAAQSLPAWHGLLRLTADQRL